VNEYNAHRIPVDTLEEAKHQIRLIGSDPQSIGIMAPKAITRVIKLEQVILQDAIIIKQDMLSIGGEVAVPKDTFALHEQKGDILIIGTLRQLKLLIEKLRRHYSRLQRLADELEDVIRGER
jgi:dihydropteroate synthase